MPQISINSPVGPLTIFEFDGVIVALDWGFVEEMETSPVLEDAKAQLADYFAGKRGDFDLPLAPDGTDFQKAVWDAMCKIPAGKTATYKDLAIAAGSPKAFQSVGTACGYSGDGGLETKRALLKIEGVDLPLGDDQGSFDL